MFKNPLSLKGRIRRKEYAVSLIVIATLYFIIFPYVTAKDGEWTLRVLLYLPLLWVLVAQGTKRCHDRGHNGWWQFIPFYFMELIFNKGDKGANEYGVNPKAGLNNKIEL